MLDEPTNHLDLASLQWLEEYLKAYKGAIIIVSHDRYFLDAVCTDIAEMFLGRIEQYEGNYTRYQRLRTERFEARQRAFDAQQKEIAHQQAVIDRLKSFNREKSLKRARSREKVLDKMELLERPQEEKQVRFSFDVRRRTGDDVLIVKDLAKGFDGRTLFEHFDLHLRAGDRAVLIGPNGVGKSTLLRLIVKEQKADDGTIRYGANVDIGYYDQQQTGLHADKTVLDELWDRFPQMEQSELRSVLGCFLFTGDDVFQPIRTLSGGEKGRVADAGEGQLPPPRRTDEPSRYGLARGARRRAGRFSGHDSRRFARPVLHQPHRYAHHRNAPGRREVLSGQLRRLS